MNNHDIDQCTGGTLSKLHLRPSQRHISNTLIQTSLIELPHNQRPIPDRQLRRIHPPHSRTLTWSTRLREPAYVNISMKDHAPRPPTLTIQIPLYTHATRSLQLRATDGLARPKQSASSALPLARQDVVALAGGIEDGVRLILVAAVVEE